jgi:hypothetical protein
MRRTISGLVAAIAVMSAAPAMACGGGLFDSSCSPCAQSYVSSCAPPVYVAPVAAYSGCYTGCGGWARERLPDPEQQYYYVNQGPTYTGPGNWAPRRTYQEGYVSGADGYRSRPYYGYGPRRSYAPRYSLPLRAYGGHYSMRYGARVGAPYRYGRHERVLRRYY